MLIMVGEESDFNNSGIIIDKTSNFFYYINYVKPELRINLLKKEIFKNLPMIIIDKRDLVIYIRSGDIFQSKPNKYYSPPPLCFYQTILKYFQFNNIYIIAQDKNNPNIEILLSQFPSIIYKRNSLKLDISYLTKAYNIVHAPSTLFFSIFQLNDNVKFLWIFDLFHDFNEKKINFLHKFLLSFNIKRKNIIVYKMLATNKYKKEMFFWKNSNSQIELMINGKGCLNFSIIIDYKL